LDRFVSHTKGLASIFGDNKEGFVRAFGMVFGGIPSDLPLDMAAVSVAKGPH
jgi:hypothetical protein